MLERWNAFKQRLALLWPDQLGGFISPALLRQVVVELIDLILYSRFGLDEQTFNAVQNTEGNGVLVSNEGLAFDFAGLVRVERNGRSLNVWRGLGPVTDFDVYFTVANSTKPRPNGQTKKGDRLRWNSAQAGPLKSTDLIRVSAMVSLASGSDTSSPSGVDTATDEETLASFAVGPHPRTILWDSGSGKVILYIYTPRVGLREVFSFDPTTPRT